MRPRAHGGRVGQCDTTQRFAKPTTRRQRALARQDESNSPPSGDGGEHVGERGGEAALAPADIALQQPLEAVCAALNSQGAHASLETALLSASVPLDHAPAFSIAAMLRLLRQLPEPAFPRPLPPAIGHPAPLAPSCGCGLDSVSTDALTLLARRLRTTDSHG